jgi:diguanylate cyclase (GGDEF)-like protein
VISLKKILPDGDGSEETLLRVLRLLLQGVERHAIEGDPDDLGTFRIGMQRFANSLEGDPAAAEMLAQAGSVLNVLEDYNRRTARYLKRPAGEWQAVVTMLLSAMGGMLSTGGEKAARLQEIAGRVRSAAALEEVHRIRLQLAEWLAEFHLDTGRQKEPDNRTTAPPEADLPPPPAGNDSVTGFSTRPQAEEALVQAWQTDPPSYVAVMTLDRLPIFNMRFGHSVGDEVLRYFGEFLQGRLRPGDRIFRWSGAALLVLLPRPNRLEIVRDEVARLMDVRCEHTVQTASRTVLLPIAARWTVFPSMAAPRLLIHKIDAFAEMKAENKAVSS